MPERPFQSVLERFPDHVKAIGMINIEVANLDIHLGLLFAVILQIPLDVGREIFLTPKSASARLELLGVVIKGMIVDKSEGRKQLESIHRRARNITNKRHLMIHDSWGTNAEGSVVRRSIRGDKGKTPVPLKELEKAISDIRMLIEDVRYHLFKLERDAAAIRDKK